MAMLTEEQRRALQFLARYSSGCPKTVPRHRLAAVNDRRCKSRNTRCGDSVPKSRRDRALSAAFT
jgi:hypothetical protein